MKVAFVYDRVNKWGGAERVLKTLWEIWPQAPLYTAVYNKKTAPWAKGHTIIPSFLNAFPFVPGHHEWVFWAMPYAFESCNLDEFDVVISVTSAEAKGVITKPGQLHVSYLLTPTRYLWSHTHRYVGHGIKKIILSYLFSKQRSWDSIAAKRPDMLVSISKAVNRRVQKYYKETASAIIYPPVETNKFTDHPDICYTEERNYFLVVSRLVGYKSIDQVIEAFNGLTHEKLMIVGEGSERNSLQAKAAPNITFVGNVSDESLACLYHHANALIFPQEEDFGITAVEAQAAGTPVIAYNKGGATETVIEGTTGILYSEPSVIAIQEAIADFKTHTWYDKTIATHAKQYDKAVFKTLFKEFVEDAWQKYRKQI